MMKIVVVDDDELFRRAVTDYLSLEGFEVDSYPHLLDLSVLSKGRLPDLIICDVILPGCSGVEILKRIRTTPGISDVPFIFLSARVEPSFQREAMNMGGDDYLTKPVSAENLLNAVRARLSRHESRRNPVLTAPLPESRITPASSSELINRFERLTPRECDVLALLIQGFGNHQIAQKLFISESTVKRHLLQVFVKLDVESRAMAIATVLRSPILVERLSKLPAASALNGNALVNSECAKGGCSGNI
jgi:DNA-binding NarL/FixJ family response regulator